MTAIDISTTAYYTDPTDATKFIAEFQPADPAYNNIIGGLFSFPCTIGTLNTATSTFPTFQAAIDYFVSLNGALLPGLIDTWLGTTGSTVGNVYRQLNLFEYLAIGAASKAYEGTTLRAAAFPVIKSATVSTGVAVFNLTADGLSTGAALFPNGVIVDSVQVSVSDATAIYPASWAFSNSNKTLTVTANKAGSTNVLLNLLGGLTSVLGAPTAAPNGTSVKLTVYGY